MVARGDLGIELPIEAIAADAEAADQARRQALRSRRSRRRRCSPRWSTSDRPTRAEVTDVANAIYDGTDAVMLSEETAIGEHPVEAVEMMDRIARADRGATCPTAVAARPGRDRRDDVAAAVAQGAVAATYRLGIEAIVVPTRSGARRGSSRSLRPGVPIVAVSPRKETVRRLNLLFGVRCSFHDEWGELRELLDDSRRDRPRGSASPSPAIWSRSPPACPTRSSGRTCSRSTRSLSEAEARGGYARGWASTRAIPARASSGDAGLGGEVLREHLDSERRAEDRRRRKDCPDVGVLEEGNAQTSARPTLLPEVGIAASRSSNHPVQVRSGVPAPRVAGAAWARRAAFGGPFQTWLKNSMKIRARSAGFAGKERRVGMQVLEALEDPHRARGRPPHRARPRGPAPGR